MRNDTKIYGARDHSSGRRKHAGVDVEDLWNGEREETSDQ